MDSGPDSFAGTMDINGDGLPDRVMHYNNIFSVQLNTTTGLDDERTSWGSVSGMRIREMIGTNSSTKTDTVDMNGDGLPDRFRWNDNPGYENFYIQLNNGEGFDNEVTWSRGGVPYDEGYMHQTSGGLDGDTIRDIFDINGDFFGFGFDQD